MRARHGLAVGVPALVVVVVAGVHVPAAADNDRAVDAIKRQFDRHNYQQALRLADTYVKAHPDGGAIVDVQVIRGQSLLKLNRYPDGKKLLQRLFEEHPALDKRADVHGTLGEAGRRRGDQSVASKHLLRAVDLYVGVGKKREGAEILFKLAELFRHHHPPMGQYVPMRQEARQARKTGPMDWKERRKQCAELVGKTYDRIVALKVDAKTSAEALFRKGRDLRDMFGGVVPYERSIEAWRKLMADYPKQERAAQAAYEIGQTYQSRSRDYVAALREFQIVLKRYAGTKWCKYAKRSIDQIKRPRIGLRISGPVLPGKKAEIHWTTRNIKTVSLKAYKVELFGMIRRFGRPEEFHRWTPPAGANASWRLAIPDQGKHEHFNSGRKDLDPTHLPIDDAGAYVVVATGQSPDGNSARAVALVLVSKLGVVSKTARHQSIVWAVDCMSGQPQPKTEVLVQRHLRRKNYEYKTGKVDDSGLYRHTYDDRKRRFGRQLAFIVRRGDQYAMCRDLYEWGWWGYQHPYRIYGFGERPVYRPEQTVRFKQIVRKHDHGKYDNAPNKKVTVRIRDPRGKVVFDRTLTTNQDGSLSGELKLGAEPPLGVYRIDVVIDGRTYNPWECKGNQFRVEEYKKPEFKVDVAAAKPSYRVGDEISIDVVAKYYFGEPVAGADVEYEVWRSEFHSTYRPPRRYPWYFKRDSHSVKRGWVAHGRRIPQPWHGGMRRELVKKGQAVTDEKGVARIGPIKATPYEKNPEVDLKYDVVAKVVDKSRREIRGAGSVKVTHAPFFIHLRPQRHLYKPGDNAQIDIVAKGPNDDPIAFEGTASIHRLRTKRIEKDGREWTEYELGDRIHQAKVKTGKDGRGRFRYPFDEEGLFRVVVSTKAEAGDEVTGQCNVWIADRGGEYAHYAYRDIELVLDRDSYETGQTMRLLINTRHKGSYVLLTGETDELLFRKIVFVKSKSAVVDLPIARQHTPNFYLMAMTLRDDKVHEDRRQVIVPPTHQFITVEAKASKSSYRPREKGKVVITAKDSAGKPVSTELAVMMVDASVYYIQPEFRKQIQEYFYGQLRPLAVTTRSSFAYRQYAYGRQSGSGGRPNLARMEMAEDRASGPAPVAPTARPAMAKAKSGRGPAVDSKEAAPAVRDAMVRKEFADSVVWMAHIKTGSDGRASVDVPMPDNLTTWKLHAVACDRNTRVGEKSIEVVTRKNLIVRLETPRFLVEKDLVYVSAIVHNYLATAKKARVELKVTPQLAITDAISPAKDLALEKPVKGPTIYRRWVEVPPGQEIRVDFVCQARSPGEVTLVGKALTDEESDAMEVKLPVLEFGADKFLVQAGYLGDTPDGECLLNIAVPAAIKPNSQTLDIRTSPSIAAVMIDALPYLLKYPYGCTEQTLSRFVPAVVTAKSLQKLGISLEDVRKRIERQGGPANKRQLRKLRSNPVYSSSRMNAMIRKGIKRLADMQHSDGGWGWWKRGESNPYMTAYAVYALAEARAADVSFNTSMLKRGVEFLKKRVTSVQATNRYRWARDDDNVRAWMLFALACDNPGNVMADAKIRAVLDRIYKDRDGLTDYGRAILTIVLAKVGDRSRAVVLIENFTNTVRLDEDTRTASWGKTRGWWRWYDNGLETTAMVLRAYLAVEPKHKHVPMIVRWLVRNRRGVRWFSTKDTAQCVYAMAEYLQASGELDPDMTVDVIVDGKLRNQLRITRENVLAIDTSTLLGPVDLGPGQHSVKIRKRGRGYLYISSYLRYYTREDPIKGAGHEVLVARDYVRLVPREVEKTRNVWDRKTRKTVTEKYKTIEYDRKPIQPGQELASGTLVEVRLRIQAKNNFEYLLFEDPKPAGCEPVDLVSGSSYAGGTYANMELRDERVVFFATYLSQGTHKLTYRLRCETPGVFNVLPTRAEAMYAPLVRAISDSHRMAVVERK